MPEMNLSTSQEKFCFPLLAPVETTHNEATLIPEMEFDEDTLRGKESSAASFKM